MVSHIRTDDLPVLEVAERTFGRWSQENSLLHMRHHEFDSDHLPTLAVEAADP